MDYELVDLIDIEQFTELIKKFSSFMGTAMGIFDTSGNVVCGAGWYSACEDYHRIHPKTAEACRKSDLAMLTGIKSWQLTWLKHFGLPQQRPKQWKYVEAISIKL